jgi:hypothetical protein
VVDEEEELQRKDAEFIDLAQALKRSLFGAKQAAPKRGVGTP